MPEHLQFPLGPALLILPVLLGGILAMWSLVFVRNEVVLDSAALFWGIFVPTMVVGLLVGSAGVWYSPEYDEWGDPHDARRDFQPSLFLAFAASLITIPFAAKMAPAFQLAAKRIRQRQLSLALLVVSVGLTGPLVFFLHTLLHRPSVLLYIGLQYAVFGFILWQLTRPSLVDEDSPQNV
jgi:hypothetical protein